MYRSASSQNAQRNRQTDGQTDDSKMPIGNHTAVHAAVWSANKKTSRTRL